MAKALFNDRAYMSFAADVPANLIGQERKLVELVPGKRTIQLYTATAGRPPLGVLWEKLEGDTNWSVRIIGRAATTVMVASGNIAANAQVKAVNGGTVVQANTGDNSLGFGCDGLAHVAGDFLEVADEYMTAY